MSRYSIGYISYVGFSSEKYYLKHKTNICPLTAQKYTKKKMEPTKYLRFHVMNNYLAPGFSYSKYLQAYCCELQNGHFPYTDDVLLFESLHDSRPMLGAGSSSGLTSSRSSWVQGCGRIGHTSKCFIVCSSPHSHVVCPSSLNNHFCIRDFHRPVPVRRRFRLDQVCHASLELGGSDSLGLNGSLRGVVWRWLDQRASLRVRSLLSRGSTE